MCRVYSVTLGRFVCNVWKSVWEQTKYNLKQWGEPEKFTTKQNLGKDKDNKCWNILEAENANPNKYRYIHKNTTSVFSSIFKVVFPNSESWESFLGNCWIRNMRQRVNFFFHFFFHTLHPYCNFTSPHFSQTFPSTSPLPKIRSSSVTLQKRTGFLGMLTKHGITRYNKTRYKLSSQSWMR